MDYIKNSTFSIVISYRTIAYKTETTVNAYDTIQHPLVIHIRQWLSKFIIVFKIVIAHPLKCLSWIFIDHSVLYIYVIIPLYMLALFPTNIQSYIFTYKSKVF